MAKRHSEYLESVKSKVIDNQILSDELFGFYKQLLEYHDNYIDLYNDNTGNVSFLRDIAPIVNADEIVIYPDDQTSLLNGLEDLFDILIKSQSGLQLNSLYDTLLGNFSISIDSLKLLLKQDIEGLKKIAGELKVGIEEYIFILVNMFKPYFINLRNNYKEIDITDWFKPICPFCGFLPDINKIVESSENARILHCGFCENEWKYRRLSCTICENEDKDKLGYYTYEDDKKYRIDYCDECKGYIKTIRIPKGTEESKYNLTVENIITNFLDSSAIEMGYSRP